MKLDINQKIKNYEGKDIVDESKKPLSLKTIFVTALNSQLKTEILTAENKSKIYQLSLKIYQSKEPDFTVDDLAFIKERVGKFYNPLVYGRVCDIIDVKEN